MEKIPYKPGDVLVSDKNCEVVVVDLSQNEYVAFLSFFWPEIKNEKISFHTTKKVLDDMGYKLKTPAKWVPEYDEEYFFIDDRGRLGWDDWNNSGSDAEIYRLKTNNVFKTEEEAIEARDKIMNTNEGVV